MSKNNSIVWVAGLALLTIFLTDPESSSRDMELSLKDILKLKSCPQKGTVEIKTEEKILDDEGRDKES